MPCLLLLSAWACRSVPAGSAAVTTRLPAYEVYAVRYGTLPAFRVSGLIAGADTSRRMDIALTVWVIRDPAGRVVLLDAGFKRPDLMARWKPTSYRLPSEAIGALGLKAEDVTDVIVSHIHWDHFDGADLFPKARIWIQRGEVQHHLDSAGKSLDRALDAPDAAMLHALRQAGRVQEIDGDAREILPGIMVYTGGKHTFASQFVGVKTRENTIVLASDNLYLYENLDRHRPIAQTLDSASNLAAQERMRRLASEPRLIVPGHDPAVFDRFPRVADGVVRIR
jgi:glyoxylase-like metal-dependent hydrolase (beta-lactamase superfamily II)